ncbi:ABC transporter substrate-binding protein [Mesorhizobium sp. CC13]|uniref:ABC transporter substrate-binding protein n=1 Tax=Mesorhizobium sp. CC13 TaxID=3029194 RepID=UPI003266722B
MQRFFCGLAAAILAVLTIPAAAQELTKVRFLHEWRFEGHVSPFLVALDKGFYKEEGLDVTIDPGTGSLDGINRIAAGAYDLGQMDLNALIKYRDATDAVPIKAVLITYNKPPFAILTLKKNNITTPKDLEGRILGAPAADAAYSHWPILAKLNDVDSSKIKIENVGFPVREALLAQGQVDAVTAFSSNKLGVKAAGVADGDIGMLLMSDFGLDLYGSAVMTNPAFMRDNPDAVRKFVKATIKGFFSAFADPEGAIASLRKYNPVAKADIELERLKLVTQLSYLTDDVRQNGFGDADMGRLGRSIEQLAIAFQFKNKPKPEDVYTAEFLPPKDERLVE